MGTYPRHLVRQGVVLLMFYIVKDGYVHQYIAIGTGSASYYTDASVRPGFRGSVNVQ